MTSMQKDWGLLLESLVHSPLSHLPSHVCIPYVGLFLSATEVISGIQCHHYKSTSPKQSDFLFFSQQPYFSFFFYLNRTEIEEKRGVQRGRDSCVCTPYLVVCEVSGTFCEWGAGFKPRSLHDVYTCYNMSISQVHHCLAHFVFLKIIH